MKILLVEDDYITRKLMHVVLQGYGDCDVVVDGLEAVDAFLMALEEGEPYDVICLDIMMPVMNGYQALNKIRKIEQDHGISEEQQVKIFITSVLNDETSVQMAFDLGCTIYFGKPLDRELFEENINKTE